MARRHLSISGFVGSGVIFLSFLFCHIWHISEHRYNQKQIQTVEDMMEET